MTFWDALLLVIIGAVIVRYGISGLMGAVLIIILGSWLFFLTMYYVFGIYIG